MYPLLISIHIIIKNEEYSKLELLLNCIMDRFPQTGNGYDELPVLSRHVECAKGCTSKMILGQNKTLMQRRGP